MPQPTAEQIAAELARVTPTDLPNEVKPTDLRQKAESYRAARDAFGMSFDETAGFWDVFSMSPILHPEEAELFHRIWPVAFAAGESAGYTKASWEADSKRGVC